MKKMKKLFMILVILASFTTFVFAGGDQNKNRHDGSKGQGSTSQHRNGK
jgi:hypothetical protein